MIISLAHAPPFRLGPLLLLPATHELEHDDGRRAVVEPRVMQVLIALARADGAIVSRDTLYATCWHGRIVGEDALNRVISRLRAAAAGIGADAFQIETVTRAGYRLIVPAVSLIASSSPDAQPPIPAPPSSRHMWLLIALALMVGIAGGTMWWVSARNKAADSEKRAPQLLIVAFTPLSPDISPAMATAARDEIVSAFGQSGGIDIIRDPAHLPPGPLSWRVSGTISREGTDLRFVIHLAHESTGKIVWSAALDRPASDTGSALKSLAAAIEEIVGWSLIDAAGYRDGALPDTATALLLQFNRDTTLPTGPYHHAEVEMRRLVTEVPDFAAGWSTLALALGYTATASDDPVAMAAARSEAPAVIATALKLHPGDALALLARAKIVAPANFAGRDAAYRAAAAAPVSIAGAEHSGYSMFLVNVGRIADAVRQAKFTYDLAPLGGLFLTRYARALSLNGQAALAAAILDKAILLWPDDAPTLELRTRSALWTGAYDEAIAATRDDPQLSSAVRAAKLATFGALQSGDPAAKQAAAATLKRLSLDPLIDSAFLVSALGALGHDGEALAAADRLIAVKSVLAADVLFDPSLAAARRMSQFTALVRRIGLFDYWRASGHPPDFCLEAGAPSMCAALRPRRS